MLIPAVYLRNTAKLNKKNKQYERKLYFLHFYSVFFDITVIMMHIIHQKHYSSET